MGAPVTDEGMPELSQVIPSNTKKSPKKSTPSNAKSDPRLSLLHHRLLLHQQAVATYLMNLSMSAIQCQRCIISRVWIHVSTSVKILQKCASPGMKLVLSQVPVQQETSHEEVIGPRGRPFNKRPIQQKPHKNNRCMFRCGLNQTLRSNLWRRAARTCQAGETTQQAKAEKKELKSGKQPARKKKRGR